MACRRRKDTRRTRPQRGIGVARVQRRHRIVALHAVDHCALAVEDLKRQHASEVWPDRIVDHRAIGRVLACGHVRHPRRRRVHVVADARGHLRRVQVQAASSAMRAAIWRSGVTLSRMRNPRPCVPAIRSSSLHLQIAHRTWRHVHAQRLPVIAIVERDIHLGFGPCIQQALTLRVFANHAGRSSRPGRPVLICFHVLPPSCVRNRCGRMSSSRSVLIAAYAVCASKCPASMLKDLPERLQSLVV